MTELMHWLNENSGAVTAMAAAVGVLVTAVYAFFTVLLWRATKRQADITQRTFEATNRPYVAVTPRWGDATADIDRLSFECAFENYGTLPAIVTFWDVLVEFSGRATGCGQRSDSETRICLFPGQPYTKQFSFKEEGIWPPSGDVKVEATVEYRGATERTYRTRMVTFIVDGRFGNPLYEIK